MSSENVENKVVISNSEESKAPKIDETESQGKTTEETTEEAPSHEGSNFP